MALPRGLLIFYVAVLGLCIGSFLNVVVWRIPQGLSVMRPASHCPRCKQQLAWWQNLPVVAWLALRGRCHHCAEPISIRYPAVEAGCGALFVAVTLTRDGLDLVPYCIAAAGMLALSLIDLEHYRLPDPVLLPTLVMTLVGFAVIALVDDRRSALGSALGGAAIGLAVLGLIHLIQPRGMGFGDVKLAVLCGLLLGWRGYGFVPVGLFAAFLLGAVVGVALMATGRVGRRARIPFGPFLCVASLATALWGGPLVSGLGRLMGF